MKNAAKNCMIIWYDELDSTNAELQRRISELDNLSVAAALTQTDGRGQKGNRWLSAPGENLTFSILLRPDSLPLSEFMSITYLATLSVRDYLRSHSVAAVIKWPNDIYAGRKKICGMLIESIAEDKKLKAAIIGVGLNLNQRNFPAELPNPTSAALLTGHTFVLKQALEELMSIFVSRCPLLETEEGRQSLKEGYEAELFQKGEVCTYRDLKSGELIEGKILGIAKDGRLNLDGRLYNFKEIGYLL